jgi:4-carboxymuconolactone decarboxylase
MRIVNRAVSRSLLAVVTFASLSTPARAQLANPPAEARQPQPPSPQEGPARRSGPLQQKVAPGLATLTDDVLFGDVWRRPELSPRDRSLVTISVLIATGKPAQLAGHLGRALTNGVQPTEVSGLLAHLAIYCR